MWRGQDDFFCGGNTLTIRHHTIPTILYHTVPYHITPYLPLPVHTMSV